MKPYAYCPQRLDVCRHALPLFEALHRAQRADRYSAMVKSADQILALCAPCPHATKDKVQTLMGLKELGEAERLVDELLAPGAKSADIYRYKAELVEDREGNKKALRWFKDAVRAESENHEANCELAFALYRLGKSREALPFALKARETKPTEDNAAATLCAILADLGERDEEIAELHRRSA